MKMDVEQLRLPMKGLSPVVILHAVFKTILVFIGAANS